MSHRLFLSMAVLFACFALVGCPKAESTANSTRERPKGLVGYYRLNVPANTPVGAVMHLGIEDDRWMMRDMMIGYGGTWKMQDGKGILTVTQGPTGKASGTEQMTVTWTEQGLELSHPKSPDMKQIFTYVEREAPKEFGYDEFLGPKK